MLILIIQIRIFYQLFQLLHALYFNPIINCVYLYFFIIKNKRIHRLFYLHILSFTFQHIVHTFFVLLKSKNHRF